MPNIKHKDKDKVKEVKKGDSVGVKIAVKVRENDKIFVVTP